MNTFYKSLICSGLLAILVSCQPQDKLFVQLNSEDTGVDFTNTITETDSINILENEYIYNGGGVGIADFNKDGLPDLYFSGNMVPNKLYLNQGIFHSQIFLQKQALKH